MLHLQLQDIKELGSVSEVATLLAPTGVTFTSQEADEVDQPARDTGTIRGTVRAKPQTLYRSPPVALSQTRQAHNIGRIHI